MKTDRMLIFIVITAEINFDYQEESEIETSSLCQLRKT